MKKYLFSFLFACLLLGMQLNASNRVVTIHVDKPGTLALDKLLKSTVNQLKITGNIDARDFRSFKMLPTLQVLDLSEAEIHAYSGTEGSHDSITSDFFVGDPIPRYYPAKTIPAHCFSVIKDNSLKKYYVGSNVINKIIVPKDLVGIDKEAFNECPNIRVLDVPTGSTTVKSLNGVLYSFDGKQLIACPTGKRGVLEIPATVTDIDEGAFYLSSLSALHFNSSKAPVSEPINISVAYVKAPVADEYAQLFPNVRIITNLSTIDIHVNTSEGVIGALAKVRVSRNEIHSLKISGELTYEDLEYLNELESLYYLDLSATANFYFFPDKFRGNKHLCSISLPSDLTSLAPAAFEGCSALTGTLVLPEGLENIGMYTFAGTNLTEVVFGKNISLLEASAFEGSAIQKADLSQTKLTGLEDNVFKASLLEEIILPSGLRKIGKETFRNCPLNAITFPKGLHTIGEFSFANTFLRRIKLPVSLFHIGDYAFCACMALEEIDFSDCTELADLGEMAFWGCPSLANIDMSHCFALKKIRKGLFSSDNISSDKKVPSRVVVTGGETGAISGLRSIIFPPAIREVESGAFSGCELLEHVDMSCCYQLNKLGDEAFGHCLSLKTLFLPPAVNELGENVFHNSSIASLTVSSVTPPTVKDNTFANCPTQEIKLRIPTETRGKYLLYKGWSGFTNIEEAGYSVSCAIEGFKNARTVIKGMGLYKEGEEATLLAEVISPGFIFSSWVSELGECKTRNTFTFSPSQHVKWIASIGQDTVNPPLPSISVSVAGNLKMEFTTGDPSDVAISVNETVANYDTGQGIYYLQAEQDTTIVNIYGGDKFTFLSIKDLPVYRIQLNECPVLDELYCSGTQIGEIDLNHAPSLRILDITNNPFLTRMDISPCPLLYSVAVNGSALGFSSFNRQYLDLYYYNLSFDHRLKMDLSDYLIPETWTIGVPYDLSRELHTPDGYATTMYVWKEVDTERILKVGADYKEQDGIFTFLNPVKAYCEMVNEDAPDILVKSRIMTINETTTVDKHLFDSSDIKMEVTEHAVSLSNLPQKVQRVNVFRMDGKLIQKVEISDSSTCTFSIGASGICIVGVQTLDKVYYLKCYIPE